MRQTIFNLKISLFRSDIQVTTHIKQYLIWLFLKKILNFQKLKI